MRLPLVKVFVILWLLAVAFSTGAKEFYRAELSMHASSAEVISLTVNGIEIFALRAKPPIKKLAKEIMDALNQSLRQKGKETGILISEKEGYLTLSFSPKTSFKIPLSELTIKADEDGKTASLVKSRLNVALGKSALAIEPEEVVAPVGEPRNYRIISSLNPSRWRILNPFSDIVRVNPSDDGFSLFGNKEGSGYLILEQGVVKKEIPFKAQYLSAYLPENLTLEFVGERPNSEEIITFAKSQLIASAEISRGSNIEVQSAQNALNSSEVTLKVKASAEGRIKVNREIPVSLERANIKLREPDVILFSNRPEQIFYPGELYSASASFGEVVHLVYHHQNRTGFPLLIRVTLENLSGAETKCLISGGTSPSMLSTYDVGFTSARERLNKYQRGKGMLLTLSSYRQTVLWEGLVSKDYSVSGNLDISVVKGGAVALRVIALDARKPHGVFTEIPSSSSSQAPLIQTYVSSPPQFHPAFIRKEFTYHPDGHWLFIRLGKGEVKHKKTGEVLAGDYGVLYEFTVTIVNDSVQFKNINVSFDATGGLARGIFIIDNTPFETPVVSPGSPYRLYSFIVSPYERREVKILTTTLNGSHYPASLIFSSD